MPATLLLSQTRIAVILSSVPVTLLFLRNNLIFLHQSSNFVLSLLNYSGSEIILFDILTYLFYIVAGVNATDILSMYSVIFSEVFSLVIFNDPNYSDNVLMLFSQC